MKFIEKWHRWRSPLLLIGAAGISGLGDFIFLVALNLLVFQMTGSAAAVAGLWIVGPLASIFTRFWAGSIIDRANRRKLMIWTDLIRAFLISLVPFIYTVYGIYIILALVSMAKAFFSPASITYITELVPADQRKQFNAFYSLTSSGAFILGPAIAGVLFVIGSVNMAIFLNAASFLISAVLFLYLPNLQETKSSFKNPLSFSAIREDTRIVIAFGKKTPVFILILGLYLGTLFTTFAMDTQEVVFTQSVVGLSELDYSLLISITGIGSILGSVAVSSFSKKLSIRMLFGGGLLMMSLGYLLYAFSNSFMMIAIGFIILGFFNSFSNTGYNTFYQYHVPIEIMGRVTSFYGLIQSTGQILLVVIVGLAADIFPLRFIIVLLSLVNLISIVSLLILMRHRKYQSVFTNVDSKQRIKVS
ncbi:predicted MFS family arabinose efflux permease [Bacillus oleivorans]|uniref:Predicted MFS family arabinose efflux permease n=1 Tax=Bacillus oleivorans TaxID=1448271 RepID=A0A285D5E4_9BACI|nr:MFS transporter [Bacillus oleivorans]SNX75027.1 predicted MFS family arabinose efflux permease [Bacillus oleivorans]